MPRSTADRISAIISCLSGIGLSSWLILMQPSPRAETYRRLVPLPSMRFCMCLVSCLCVPGRNDLPTRSGQVLFVTDLLHPIDGLAVELFLNSNVRHGCGWRGTVPM